VPEITYIESFDDFPNPERGFYHHRSLTESQEFDLRGENITLVFGRIRADSFRYKPFSEEFLQSIQKMHAPISKQSVTKSSRKRWLL
jgi:hypothetical protein